MKIVDYEEFHAEHWLQCRVAETYKVSPVDSFKYFEEYEDDGGKIHRMVHFVFGVSQKDGELTPALKESMARAVWDSVRLSFPVGTDVVWRRRPVFITEELDLNFDTGVTPPDMVTVHRLTLRLGAEQWKTEELHTREGVRIRSLDEQIVLNNSIPDKE